MEFSIRPLVRGKAKLEAVEQFGHNGFRFLNEGAGAETYSLRILHTNDHHAHIDPIVEASVTPPRNHGGLSRRKTLIDQQRAEARRQRMPLLLLDAGDVFQGTLYFSVFKGQADISLYRQLRYHAMTIGNHEFDAGQQVLADFIASANDRTSAGRAFPVLSANIVVDKASPLTGRIKPRLIHRAGKERIGIFGVTTEETPQSSDPGPGIKFTDAVAAARAQVAALQAVGVNKIIALTHLGFGQDQRLAREVAGISLIIGGHSHTPLGPQPGSAYAYPTIETNPDGDPVLVVTSWEWGRWLGRLDISFDAAGVPRVITGVPVEVAAHADGVLPDACFEALIAEYRKSLDQYRGRALGISTVFLDGTTVNSRSRETNLGNLICDAMLWKMADEMDPTLGHVSIMNGGGIRTSIEAGPVSYGQVLEVLPFGSTLARLLLTGQQVRALLEHGVSQVGEIESTGRFAQVGGVRYHYSADRAVGQRVLAVQVCVAGQYVPLDDAATYIVLTNSFLMRGGDGYTTFAEGREPIDTGLILADVVADYIVATTPITSEADGRITADIQRILPIYLED